MVRVHACSCRHALLGVHGFCWECVHACSFFIFSHILAPAQTSGSSALSPESLPFGAEFASQLWSSHFSVLCVTLWPLKSLWKWDTACPRTPSSPQDTWFLEGSLMDLNSPHCWRRIWVTACGAQEATARSVLGVCVWGSLLVLLQDHAMPGTKSRWTHEGQISVFTYTPSLQCLNLVLFIFLLVQFFVFTS